MPDKLTDSEIVKALKCCMKSSHFGECFENKCPLVSEKGCEVGKETLYPYALDLINRLQAENERLKNALTDHEYGNCVAVKNGLIYTHTLEDYDELIGDISAEAYKEFADMFVTALVDTYDLKSIQIANIEKIKNNLLKELVGEDDGKEEK